MSHDDIVSRIKDKLGEFNGYDTLENRNSSDDLIRGFIKDEMTKMIETVRAFESYQKVIQTIDQVDERSVNSLGRIG